MDPKQLFADSRLSGYCVYCGAPSETRDHVPSRVLLDEPYPNNLPVVECCGPCNSGFSSDEEYFACFLSCVIHGTTSPEAHRPKIARILREKPLLGQRMEASMRIAEDGQRSWIPEMDRVRTVILKLARGHIAYELSLPRIEEPEDIRISLVPLMTSSEIDAFLADDPTQAWPEIGSRAFVRAAKSTSEGPADHWIIVQPNRYQYFVSQSNGSFVRFLVGGYLACEVLWD